MLLEFDFWLIIMCSLFFLNMTFLFENASVSLKSCFELMSFILCEFAGNEIFLSHDVALKGLT